MPTAGEHLVGPAAVGFVDLAGYTELVREMGPTELTTLLDRFDELCLREVNDRGGQLVKMLGDGALYFAEEASTGADIAAAIVAAVEGEAVLPQAHAGVAFGRILQRSGDVFGRTVNLASRLAEIAPSGAVWVDQALADQLPPTERSRLGKRLLASVAGDAAPGQLSAQPDADPRLVDTRSGWAYERVPKSEVEELVLEEVPDISYADIGGLSGQTRLTAAGRAVVLQPGRQFPAGRRADVRRDRGEPPCERHASRSSR